MAQVVKVENKQNGTTEEVVTYETGDGQEITLTNSMVRQITNNNEYITDGEILLFINLCKFQKLNPFTREAYLVKYQQDKPAQFVTSLGAFMRIADEQPNYEGIEDGIIIQNSKGEIVDRVGCVLYPKEIMIGGWAKVYRADRKIPSEARLSLKEYSKSQSTWNQMPSTMINKCAKVSALRKAFPRAFQAMYEEDELKGSGVIDDVAPKNNENVIYDIPTVEAEHISVDTVVQDKVRQEQPQPQPKDEDGIEYIKYNVYKENKEKYIAVPYPNTISAYDEVNHTMRVRKKV